MSSAPDSPDARPGVEDAPASSWLLGRSVRILTLESFSDDRGVLNPLTFDDWGFIPARAFVVRAPQGAVRGGHAHRRVRQVLFRASGVIQVELRQEDARAQLTLDDEHPAVLLEAGIWAQQTYVAPESVLVVFADGPYDPAEYILVEHHSAGVES